MKDTGPSAPRWALLSPAAAPPILTFNEPTMNLHVLSGTDSSHNASDIQLPPPYSQLAQPDVRPRQPIIAGEACFPEGQWNCMTTSWQRCASGSWSAVVPCATGTMCQPFGLTDHITIEHTTTASDSNSGEAHQEDNGHASEGSKGDGGGKGGKKSSSGMRNSPGLCLLLGMLLAGVFWELLV
ncbi:hypothetical protein V8C44DRAFT_324103 [Trichoderma aethiopicum]